MSIDPTHQRATLINRSEFGDESSQDGFRKSVALASGLGSGNPNPGAGNVNYAAVASAVAWSVNFDDSGGAYSAYYADISRVLLAAGSVWSTFLGGSGNINIDVSFAPATGFHATSSVDKFPVVGSLNSNLLLDLGPAYEVKTGLDPNGSIADLHLQINVDYLGTAVLGAFWFDPDPLSGTSIVPDGKRDALSTFEHEIGHALGITTYLNRGTGAVTGVETLFDSFVTSMGGIFYFNGPNAVAVNDGHPVPLASFPPGDLHEPSNIDHVADPADVMFYTRAEGPAGRKPIGALDLAILNDCGVPIASGTSGNDVLKCVAGQTGLDGGNGNDRLSGASGSDFIFGGSGNDVLSSGTGGSAIGRLSSTYSGTQGNDESSHPSISANGRFVAFASLASNLVRGDTNATADIFLADADSGLLRCVSLGMDGSPANGLSWNAAISADGRFVAFTSRASNLVAGDTNGAIDVFVYDSLNQTIRRISSDTDTAAEEPVVISGDGRFIAFLGGTGPGQGPSKIELFDTATNTSTQVNPNSFWSGPSSVAMSADGRLVVYNGQLTTGVNGGDIYLYDRVTGTTQQITTGSFAGGFNSQAAISADGSTIAFVRITGAGDIPKIYVFDRASSATELISIAPDGSPANGADIYGRVNPSLSADGRFVVYSSDASNLVAGDSNGAADIFLNDRVAHTTKRISLTAWGDQSNGSTHFGAYNSFANFDPVISANGSVIAFDSFASNLITGDTNSTYDVFRVSLAAGSDMLDGAGGLDYAVFPLPRTSYLLARQSDGSWLVTGPSGTTTLSRVERAQFSDQALSLRLAPVFDFSGEGNGDILFQHADGSVAVWLQNGLVFTGADDVGTNPGTQWVVKGAADFDGDAQADILFQNASTGQVYEWQMNGLALRQAGAAVANAGTQWKVIGTGDFNSDLKYDVLLQNNVTNQVAVWLMNGLGLIGGDAISASATGGWQIKGVGDFDGDAKSDILLQNSINNQVAIWTMSGLAVTSADAVHADAGTQWKVKGTGDFNGDGKSDILLQNNTTSDVAVWLMNGLNLVGGDAIHASAAGGWNVVGSEDLDGNGSSDVLMQNTNGSVAAWLMNGLQVVGANAIGSNPGSQWHVISPTG